MAPNSTTLAWRIPGTGEPGGLPSMGSHRAGHNWRNLAATAAVWQRKFKSLFHFSFLCLFMKLHLLHLFTENLYFFFCELPMKLFFILGKLSFVLLILSNFFFFLNNGTALFIFFNQKNMSHVSGRETRYLQALLWVSGSSRPSREEGLGLETGVGWGVRGGVCLWPPGTRSLLEVAITAAGDRRTQHWALVADAAFPPVLGLPGQRVDDPWVQTWVWF